MGKIVTAGKDLPTNLPQYVENGKLADVATKPYVKEKTRAEHGTANFRGTNKVQVTFAQAFVKRPHVVVTRGTISGLSTTGFMLELVGDETADIDYAATPADPEV